MQKNDLTYHGKIKNSSAMFVESIFKSPDSSNVSKKSYAGNAFKKSTAKKKTK